MEKWWADLRAAIALISSFLVPTRWRGNAFATRQRRCLSAPKHGTSARPEWIPTPARGNQRTEFQCH
jgi:hypothetical protein